MTTIRAEAHAVQDGVRDDAWDAIITLDREHGQRLYGYALRLGVDSGRAADLVQEALLRLWRELGRGTVVASPEAWTYRALSRLAMDEHRLHRRIAGLVSRLGDRTAARVMEVDSIERLAIWSQVDSLPDRQRRVIYLRYRADLSFDEIGQVMGIEPGAARSIVRVPSRRTSDAAQLVIAAADGSQPAIAIGPEYAYGDRQSYAFSPDGKKVLLDLVQAETYILDTAGGSGAPTSTFLSDPSWQRLAR